MWINAKTLQALLALIYLTRRGPENPIPLGRLALDIKTPPRPLKEVLDILEKGDFIQRAGGKPPGYLLSRDPATVTLAEVIYHFEGAFAGSWGIEEHFAALGIDGEDKLVRAFRGLRQRTDRFLRATTIADVV